MAHLWPPIHKSLSKWRKSAVPVATGLICAQMLATLYVGQSNRLLVFQIRGLISSGWMPLPTGPAADALTRFENAFRGGLFFTLTVGAALTLAAWSLTRLWQGPLRRSRWGLIMTGLMWAGATAALNSKGFVLYPTLFVLLVPAVTAASILRLDSWGAAALETDPSRSNRILPALVLVLLAALWFTQFQQNLFITIRDRILLSNPIGSRVNDFYYRYTLYAAEPFKSFDQKSIRSCRLEVDDAALKERLTAMLADQDVLASEAPPDVTIRLDGNRLRLVSGNGDSIEAGLADFLAQPRRILQEFSKACDRLGLFRRLILISLLLGFPILLYSFFYSLLRLGALLLLPPRPAEWGAAGVCLLLGIALLIPVAAERTQPIPAAGMGKALAQPSWTAQAAALRQIEQQRLDIARWPEYRELLQSPSVVVRYYLARALGKSRDGKSFSDLLALAADPNPNVVCQAYYALGAMGRKAAIEPIRARMSASDHWYTQWYAYRALRSLGWSQTQLKQQP